MIFLVRKLTILSSFALPSYQGKQKHQIGSCFNQLRGTTARANEHLHHGPTLREHLICTVHTKTAHCSCSPQSALVTSVPQCTPLSNTRECTGVGHVRSMGMSMPRLPRSTLGVRTQHAGLAARARTQGHHRLIYFFPQNPYGTCTSPACPASLCTSRQRTPAPVQETLREAPWRPWLSSNLGHTLPCRHNPIFRSQIHLHPDKPLLQNHAHPTCCSAPLRRITEQYCSSRRGPHAHISDLLEAPC